MSRPQPEGTIHISDIALDVRQESGKILNHIVFQTKTGILKKEIPVSVSPGNMHKEVFDPALELSVRDQLSISARYRSQSQPFWSLWRPTLSITMKLSEVEAHAQDVNHGRKIYFEFRNNIEVTIGISCYSAPNPVGAALPPTTDEIPDDSRGSVLPPITSEILDMCPRFRLLIIGNSGVGKSTLIQRVFGVKDVDVSENSRGKAKIDREFVAEDNGLFVLHDSLGLEAGESNNMDKIKGFISRRRQMADLKDRLHAVWVCLSVPYAKGRLLETGMEEFLRNREQILGDIPIVVVLTKLDLLDRSLLLDPSRTGGAKSLEEARQDLQPHRSRFLEEYCAKPLLRAAGGDIPRVAVSTKSGFGWESTISTLVKTTTSEIERYVRTDPTYGARAERSSLERDAPIYIAGMAQRASIEAKVSLTIALGKRRYWKNLSASLKFSSDKVKMYLLVIHEDVIQGWNFNDPGMVLRGEDLQVALLDTSNLGVCDIRDLQTALGPATSVISVLDPLITSLYGVVLMLPIAATAVLASICYEIYKSSKTIVKRFMAYIVDLIYVMKILFILAPERPITSEDVALALKVYEKSTYRNRIHLEIRDFNAGPAVLPGGRDAVMEKIEVLIRRYNITDEEVTELRDKFPSSDSSAKV